MNYAVVKLQGHQEIITSQTKEMVVDRLNLKAGEKVKPQVLLANIGGDVKIGTPTVEFPVELEVARHERGEKLHIFKYHAKARTRRKIGFRADQTILKLTKFGREVLVGKEKAKGEKLQSEEKTKSENLKPKTKKIVRKTAPKTSIKTKSSGLKI